MKIGDDPFLFLRQSLISLKQKVMTGILNNIIIRFISIVVTCLSYQKGFKLLFVNLFWLIANFDQHLNNLLQVDAFYCLTIPFFFDVT